MNHVMNDQWPSIHSEEDAWFNFKRKLKQGKFPSKWLRKGLTLINLAVTKTYQIRMSKPCTRCAKLIQKQQSIFRKIYWTTADGSVESCSCDEVMNDSIPSSADKRSVQNPKKNIKKNLLLK